MAITRSQQARQMLKEAGFVVQDGFKNYIKNSESVTVPKEFKSKEDATPTKLAYITKDEAKMLKKMKKGTPHKGPKGIPSYDDYDAETGSFRSGAAMSAAESGRNTSDTLAAGMSNRDVQDLRSAAIAAGAGQRVNPGFFDSRNVVSPEELRAAKQFAPKAFARTRGGGLMNFITGGGFLGNLIRGLGQRFGLGKRFDQPTYDMSRFSGLPLGGSASFENLDIRDKFNRTPDDEEDDTIPIVIDNDMSLVPDRGLLEVPGIPITPYQKDVMEQISEEATGDDPSGLLPYYRDGGMIGGGIMDAAGRQNYFLGKLVKKATRAVKKVVKSPIGRLGLFAAASAIPFGASKASLFQRFMDLDKGKRMLAGAGLLSAAPLLFGQEEEEQPTGFTGSVGGQIPDAAYTDPRSVMFRAFRMADGGSIKEPVAKKTMPLLDMGGQEMDLRAEGGFVPIGRMEKADDVPARLSKNEFVFTADAVRNAGDGDVDKGAEVMYNMMKNLEAGGDVSEESQGLEGAREMFQTSKRLEDVV